MAADEKLSKTKRSFRAKDLSQNSRLIPLPRPEMSRRREKLGK